MSRYTLPPGEQMRRNQMFTKGFLWCNYCKEFKSIDNFYKARAKSYISPFGYRRYCIECEYQKRDHVVQKKSSKERNYGLKKKFVDLAGGSCQRCGFNEFATAMDFHHVYLSEKKYEAVRIIYSNNFKKTWAELDKCCLLCRNCHAAYTGNEWRAEFIKRDGLGWTVGDSLPLDDNRYESKPAQVQQSAFPIHLLKAAPVQLSF